MSEIPPKGPRCARPGCSRRTRPDQLACGPDWKALPRSIQDRIWANYVPGQTLHTASNEYLDALRDALRHWEGMT